MILTVTRVVIIGDKRVEDTATAQIDRRGDIGVSGGFTSAAAHAEDQKRRRGDLDTITDVTRALFDSLTTTP